MYNVTFVMTHVSITTTVDAADDSAAYDLALRTVNEELGFSISPFKYSVEVEEV